MARPWASWAWDGSDALSRSGPPPSSLTWGTRPLSAALGVRGGRRGVRVLHELLRRSDYISIHSPKTDDTYHLFDETAFRQMKPTAYLINTSRGSVVDEAP